MDLRNIYHAIGKPGLFELISTNKSGAIIESLIDKKRIQMFASDKLTSVKDVSLFTTGDDVPLEEVFKTIYLKENGEKCIDPKSDNTALKNYMKEVLPEYDQDRVYVSDMKKLFSWYNLLVSENKLDFSEDEKEASEENIAEESK
ncbi:MAG: DUF5606 domain-containing protein [Bacteroidota bacterium]